MRIGSGAGMSQTTRRAASGRTSHVIVNGQSLGTGTGQTAVSTSQPFANVMVHDSSGTYDITQPNAGTLSLVPLVAPPRSGVAATPYPTNVAGTEDPDVAFCNQLTALFRAHHYDDFLMASTCIAIGGAPMSSINKGGAFNAYAAGIFEANVVKRFRPSSSPMAILFVHGEADATAFNTAYQSQLVTLQANYQTDLQSVYGTSAAVPMLISQQQSSPVNFTGPNLTAANMLALALTSGFLFTGPKYQFPQAGDFLHEGEYRAFSEKSAEALFRFLMYGQQIALLPTNVTRVGQTVTVTFRSLCPPLVFDPGILAPHLSGVWNMWAAGLGFEAWDNPLTIQSVTGNGVLIGVTFTTPHNYGSNGTQVVISVQSVLGNTAANGVFTATVTSPTAVTLNGTTGNGAFTGLGYGAGPTVFTPIGITSASVVNPMSYTPQVQITLSRAPTTGQVIAYGEQSDCAYGANTLGIGQGRWGTLHDSDPFWLFARSGPKSATFLPASYYYNWCPEFSMAMP
jgi:hypothetical protein